MTRNNQNIDLSGNGFPERLRMLRIAAGLSKTELADKAGVSGRTVHDMERGARPRAQEKTLLLLAEALGVTLDELLGQADPPPPSRQSPAQPHRSPSQGPRILLIPAIVVLFLAAAGLLACRYALVHAEFTQDQRHLVVRDGLLGRVLWELGGVHGVQRAITCPWDPQIILASGDSHRPRSRLITALKKSNGDTLWSIQPDLDAIRRAFGQDVLDNGNLSCNRFLTADLDGDDVREAIGTFTHSSNFPFVLLWFDRGGRIRGQYTHQGHLLGFVVADLDHDGKDEIFACGTNNARRFGGPAAVILDDEHFRGAAVDKVTFPGAQEPDSALARLALPTFPEPYMRPLADLHLGARLPRVRFEDDGHTALAFTVYGDSHTPICILDLDDHLHIRSWVMEDMFTARMPKLYPDSLIAGAGPGDPAWMQAWLDQAEVFGPRPAPGH